LLFISLLVSLAQLKIILVVLPGTIYTFTHVYFLHLVDVVQTIVSLMKLLAGPARHTIDLLAHLIAISDHIFLPLPMAQLTPFLVLRG